jgi:hypothetical protein
MLALVLFSAIVITCGYESIISSHLIIPPPLIVARRLKDLVDTGYGIIGHNNNISNTSIVLILKREKISHSSVIERPFVPNTHSLSLEKSVTLLSNCNSTGAIHSSIPLVAFQEQLDQIYPRLGIRCHFVKETRRPNEELITYSGYSAETVHTFVSSFQESGILDMLYSLRQYVEYLQVRIRTEKREYAEKKAEVPFELRDPKIISIFAAWGVLLIGASLAFTIESLPCFLTYLRVIIAATI